MRLKSLLPNLGLLFATIIVFFGMFEIALRVTGIISVAPNPPKIYEKDPNPEISYRLKKNWSEKTFRSTVMTDSLGLRSPEPDPRKPTIAVIGDSVTFGYGVEDSETLSARLAEHFPDKNLLNAGVPGYELRQEAALYHEVLDQLKPQALVLNYYWNDLESPLPAFLDPEGILRPAGWTSQASDCAPIETGILSWIPGGCWLDQHSALYKLVKKVISVRSSAANLAEQRAAAVAAPKKESFTEDQFSVYVKDLEKFSESLPPSLKRIFVIWPDQYLHPDLRKRLKATAEHLGWKVIDLYDTFSNNLPVLGWDTVHPSAAAVKSAAEVIAPILQQELAK